MRWAGHAARMEDKNAYKLLVGNPVACRSLGTPKRREEDDIKKTLNETGGGQLSQDTNNCRDSV